MLADLLLRVCARRVVLNGWPGDLPFQKRRSAAFEADLAERGLRLRIHKSRKPSGTDAHRSENYVDIAVDESIDNSVPSKPSR
jgi:hypothetical protein